MTEMKYGLFGEGPEHYGTLGPAAFELWEALDKFIRTSWPTATPDEQERLGRIRGSLDKLSGVLLQVARLRDHEKMWFSKTQQLIQSGGAFMAARALTAILDFELLVLQARTTLDRLTWFIASEFGQQCQSYTKLGNILRGFQKRARARAMLSVLDGAASWFDAFLGQLDSDQALRDLLAHKHAATEGIETTFALYLMPGQRVVLTDCEVSLPRLPRRVAILQSGPVCGQFVTFIVLNLLAISCETAPLPLEAFGPVSHSRAISLSDYLLATPAGTALTENTVRYVRRFTPAGFELTTAIARPEFFDRSVEINSVVSVPPKETR